ncbi:MAG: hypothetical protein IKN04_02605 [Clostridia bacterium]|nr:hypothetical protein [Clostridia bacterium]
MKGPQPLHQYSAGGGVYAAEERLCRFLYQFLAEKCAFSVSFDAENAIFQEIDASNERTVSGLSFAACRKFFFDTLSRRSFPPALV